MKRVLIKTKVTKTELLRKIEVAENAVKKLCDVLKEFEFMENGMSEEVYTEEKEGGEGKYLYILKTINDDAIKEHVESVKELMELLKKEVGKLDKAIYTELTKEKPRNDPEPQS